MTNDNDNDIDTDIYFYKSTENPLKVLSTESLDELIILIHNLKADFLSEAQIIEQKLPSNYNIELKKIISSYEDRVPMYDINYNHIFPIHKSNVYPKIFYDNYRFIDQEFYDELKSIDNPSQTDIENIQILSHYDFDLLFKVYMKIFYESFILNSYITRCKRPSYDSRMEHMTEPYYSINELYFLAYDWNLVPNNQINLTQSEIKHYCKQIASKDITAQTLLDHQMYIYKSRAIGLIKHYSLFGSYYMNQYLRKNRCTIQTTASSDQIRDADLENQIRIMINIMISAPAFDKSYIVYRFIEKDDYMRHLKIGDVYIDPSFMSTTRNPFYYKENYSFGYYLIKIKLPSEVRGVGLCIESYSNFPKEEEIILPPTTRYKLTNIANDNIKHFHNIFKIEVIRKYEFEWIGNNYLDQSLNQVCLSMPDAFEPVVNDIDVISIIKEKRIEEIAISDRFKYFRDEFINNINNQFACTVGNYRYVFTIHSYDSSSVYKPFFYYEMSDGIMITTSNPKRGNINIMMELGPKIHVNYYFRFSLTDEHIAVDLNRSEWIDWFSNFAYTIGSRYVVFHSSYSLQYNPNDSVENQQMKTRYVYSQNMYLYLKNRTRMFEFRGITPNFSYPQIDILFTYPITDIIHQSDTTELYRVAVESGLTYMAELYIYIVEHIPKLIKIIENKMEEIYPDPNQNPFLNMSYELDVGTYLYDRNLIIRVPSDKEFAIKKGSFKKIIGENKITKFKNRLRTYLVNPIK